MFIFCSNLRICLVHSTAIVAASSYDELKKSLSSFFTPLLTSLNFAQLNLFTTLEGTTSSFSLFRY